ncbi:hypothetical protein [Nocardioides ungokensis]|uniref:hypothetical protein n=1 Tax=Nocardioides ungokensis TaxID=1643322 RepID=UPI0015DE345A|nr:hypothetical protein [Nocardioides ungokensis]
MAGRAHRAPGRDGFVGLGDHGSGQGVQLRLVDEHRQADPRRAEPCGLGGRAGRHDRDRAHPVTTQVLGRGEVEPGCVETEHRHSRLAGAGRGQQVVDVHAALQHHDRGVPVQELHGPRLPGRAGSDDQHDDHRLSPVVRR